MDLSLETIGDVALATVPVEELDAGNVGDFKQSIASVVDTQAKLVIDLDRVRFLDSSGLGALLSCLKRLNARGGDLRLCGLSTQVRTVVELVRLHKVVGIYPNRADAVASFAVPR
jgi:anti-sigma B factor antagonist